MITRKTFEEVDIELSEELGDLVERSGDDGNRFSGTFRRDVLNEGQFEFVERSGILRSRAAIIAKENRTIYNLPGDCIRPIRLEDKNGRQLQAAHSKQLQDRYGNSFRKRDSSSTGEPLFYYSDLAGEGQFELYPRPTTNFNKSPLEFTVGTLAGRINLEETIEAFDTDDSTLYVLTANNLHYYRVIGDDLIFEKTVNHAKNINPGQGDSPLRVIKYQYDAGNSSLVAAAGNVFFADGADLISVAVNGTITTHGTASASIEHILEFEFHSPEKIYLQLSDFSIVSSLITSGYTEVAVSSESGLVFQSTGNFENRDIYFSMGTRGIKRLDTSAGTVGTAITTNFISGIGTIQDPDNRIYYLDHTDSLVKYIDPADDSITATTLSFSVNSSNIPQYPIASNLTDTFWYYDRGTVAFGETGSFFQEVIANVKTRTVFPNFRRDFLASEMQHTAVVGEVVFTQSTIDTILISSFEHGVISNIDDTTFNQEEGIILDITEDMDILNFNLDEGNTEIFSIDTEVGYVNYVRCPQKDIIEIQEFQALIEYGKFRAKKMDKDAKSIREAAVYWNEFLRYADRAAGRTGDGFVPNAEGTALIDYGPNVATHRTSTY